MLNTTHVSGRMLNSAPTDVTAQCDGHPPARINTSDDVVNPGTTATRKVTKPAAAKTYLVWLVR